MTISHPRALIPRKGSGSTTTIMIISAWWLRTSSKFSGKVRSQRNNRKTRKWTTPKRVRIRPKYNGSTVAFSWQEDKYGTKKQIKAKLNISLYQKHRSAN